VSALELYSYYRSSSSFRVRLALALKNIECRYRYINLRPGVDEQQAEDFTHLNPQGRVPLLVDNGLVLSQSSAIIEYLEETYPQYPLLPVDKKRRARVRQLVNIIACDIQPLNNLAVLNYLRDKQRADENGVKHWYQHWITQGFNAVESLLQDAFYTGEFCCEDSPGLADIYLVPQVWNARRFGVSLDGYDKITQIDAACQTIPAFITAMPENQADALG